MRIFRIVAIVAGTLVALVLLGVIALLLFVDPNRYRGDIEKAAQEHSARVLTIHGKLELKVFPWLALSVHDVELSNRPGFGKQPFLTVQNASIGVKLLPLLSQRLEVSRVKLEGANINLVTRGEQNNWQDLGEESKDTPKKPADSSGLGTAVSIEGVDVSKTSVVYSDEVKKSTTELGNLELHTGRLETGPARTALEKVELEGTYLAHTAPAADGQPGSSGTGAADVAKPLAFSLNASALALDNQAHTLAPTKIEVKVGDFAVDVSVSGEKMSTERVMTGSITVPRTSARKLLQSLGIAPPITRDPGVLSALALQTNFRVTQKQLQLSALQLTLDDTQVQGTAGIDDLDTSALRFDLNVNGINVDRYRAPVEKVPAAKHPSSPPPAAPPTPLPLETLRKLDVNGTLHVASATFSNLVFTDVVMPLVAKDGHIRLGPTQARLYGGTYNGDIVLDARPVQAQLSLNEHLHGTDIGALVKAAFDSARLSGRADADVAVTGVGNTDDAIKRSLTGKIGVNVKQGAIVGVDIVFELQRVNALLKRQVPSQRAGNGPPRTNFNALQMNGGLDKGVLRIDDLQMATDFLKVHGRGTLDTVSEAINYQLVAAVNKLPAGNAPAGAGGGLDALGAVEVPLTITGTMSSPTVRPDIEALAKGKLGQEVQQKAGDLVKKKLGDKLKDLFGH
ncbi:MAG: AsmA protein [Gammaproteobacteria bacterium]|jgi:AsmA protein|nr:AsmA protein [Gammaproteobacteria bacterium]